MKIITEAQLATMLQSVKTSTFVSVVTQTSPKMNKFHRVTKEANPYLGRVQRMAVRHGQLGTSYEKVVNNRRDQEGHPAEFKADSLWGGAGEHVEGCKSLARHKTTGRLYMVFYPTQNVEGHVRIDEDCWTLDGEKLDAAGEQVLQAYLPPVKEGAPKQELDRAVAWRVIGLENVIQLTLGGETYMVTH